jgi:hypothetical protein
MYAPERGKTILKIPNRLSRESKSRLLFLATIVVHEMHGMVTDIYGVIVLGNEKS